MIQLEYWLEGDWREVVRYDHDRAAAGGHDITEEGLHRDVYRDGEKIRSEDVSPSLPANEGFDAAEEDLRENVEKFVKRLEQWHGVKDGRDLWATKSSSQCLSTSTATSTAYATW
ncbi:hypothetical protein ACFQMF_06130 [Halorubrum rutilum]|uniref:DUF7718 domain-containing protein n=1 Tax=Halorubrum rutilum TaxID=1364933 RepID=A0ABD6AIP2_9EURY|nr:hypothetical protein [Halorubrum rutilum]